MLMNELWESLVPIGRDERTGGYRRFAWTRADLACREWFRSAALERSLQFAVDGNGYLWAWWDEPGAGAVVTGSHLDSVPDGGAFDGALGVFSAFAAIDLLRERSFTPSRPIGVVAFVDEEGARFGIPCTGSRLLTGSLDPRRIGQLRDADGVTMAEAMTAAGIDPAGMGRDREALARMHAFVELHIEQGRALVDRDAPVALATSIWPHGRWRLDIQGEANHAGTTHLDDRRDAVMTLSGIVAGARDAAVATVALATVGRVAVEPNGTNTVASCVHAWLDARAPDGETLMRLVERIESTARRSAAQDRTTVTISQESYSAPVEFDPSLLDRIQRVLGDVPAISTGAGHDAGVVAAEVPTAMMFVRNPTGISHSPAEFATEEDCAAGVDALASALESLASD
jgi:beta-ureidopropionase / N-carbamoyl-L-amino-acid hydrolase